MERGEKRGGGGKRRLLFLRLVLEFGNWNSGPGFLSEFKSSSSLTARMRAVARMQQCVNRYMGLTGESLYSATRAAVG